MKEKRVDIKLNDDILRIAAIEAAKLGISRRQFLADCVKLVIKNKLVKNNNTYKVEEY